MINRVEFEPDAIGDLDQVSPKLRIGDYRVVYEIESETQALVIVRVGHRRDLNDQ